MDACSSSKKGWGGWLHGEGIFVQVPTPDLQVFTETASYVGKLIIILRSQTPTQG